MSQAFINRHYKLARDETKACQVCHRVFSTKAYAGTQAHLRSPDHNLRASIQAPVLVSLQYTVGTSGDLPWPLKCTTGRQKAGSVQIQIPCESCRNPSKNVKFSLLSPVFAQEGESVPLAIVSWAGCNMQESKTSVQESRHKLGSYIYIIICKQAEPSAWTIANTLTLQNHHRRMRKQSSHYFLVVTLCDSWPVHIPCPCHTLHCTFSHWQQVH